MEMKRTRIKITIAIGVLITLMSILPAYVIIKATTLGKYDLASTWMSLATMVTAIATVSGYYLSRETSRPSFVNNTTVDVGGLLEDESDPEEIPL
jgi:hypothetical protein